VGVVLLDDASVRATPGEAVSTIVILERHFRSEGANVGDARDDAEGAGTVVEDGALVEARTRSWS
jgi:hypothetical protein